MADTNDVPSRHLKFAAETGRWPSHAERQCAYKRRHPHEASARAEADRLWLAGEHRIRAYECPQCHHWHVGRTRKDGSYRG